MSDSIAVPGNRFLNLHQCLNISVDPERETAMVHASYRLSAKTKEQAEKICQGHGTTLSKFLRTCVEQMVIEFNSVDNG